MVMKAMIDGIAVDHGLFLYKASLTGALPINQGG